MSNVRIGVIREGKIPPDHRVPLSPEQCARAMREYPNLEIRVQPSPIRRFTDGAYEAQGITLQDDLSDCDILIGVKEVPLEMLIPHKTYLFFSHTFKLQPYNAALLREILDKKIRLIDYEAITDKHGKRLIGFGRYAGIVGCYNGLRTYGLKHGIYNLKPAHECEDRIDLESELLKVRFIQGFKLVLTGFGRVGHGAREILDLLPLKEVDPDTFLNAEFDGPVFTQLDTQHYNVRKSDGGFDKAEFYEDPSGYESNFPRFAHRADMYIACHFYGEGAPYLYTREDVRHPDWSIDTVADISCDVDGPVASTIQPSTISDPIYGYDPATEQITDFREENAIAVMAVDNLPCELPKDASEDFGEEFMKHVMPLLVNGDKDDILWRATETTLKGELTPHFAYLKDYAKA